MMCATVVSDGSRAAVINSFGAEDRSSEVDNRIAPEHIALQHSLPASGAFCSAGASLVAWQLLAIAIVATGCRIAFEAQADAGEINRPSAASMTIREARSRCTFLIYDLGCNQSNWHRFMVSKPVGFDTSIVL